MKTEECKPEVLERMDWPGAEQRYVKLPQFSLTETSVFARLSELANAN